MNISVNNVLNIIIFIGTVGPVVVPLFVTLRLKAKNERVKLALTFAIQVVESIGDATRYLPESRKQEAIDKLSDRLEDNGIGHKFTLEQLEGYINQTRKEVN